MVNKFACNTKWPSLNSQYYVPVLAEIVHPSKQCPTEFVRIAPPNMPRSVCSSLFKPSGRVDTVLFTHTFVSLLGARNLPTAPATRERPAVLLECSSGYIGRLRTSWNRHPTSSGSKTLPFHFCSLGLVPFVSNLHYQVRCSLTDPTLTAFIFFLSTTFVPQYHSLYSS
jgi:hypothetical protein